MSGAVHDGINTRRLVFYFMVLSFAVLPISGVLLHVVSKGQVDEQMHHACMAVHNLASTVFVLSVIVHLMLNSKTIAAYVRGSVNAARPRMKELFIAFMVMAALVVLGIRNAFH